MTTSNLSDRDELEIQIQKRVAELENANKELRAENIALNRAVTKGKRVEEALRQSEKRYRILHENMRDAFAQVSMDGRIIEFNDLFCKMLGYSPEEMCKLNYQELTPERWHAFEDCIVREQVILHGYSDVYEKEYRRKNGTIIPVELRTILSRDTSGRPNGMWAIVRDITERKRTEEALKKAYETLEEKVKKRTVEFENAYISLKEIEKGLAEAQKMAHIGNWSWDFLTGEVYWSDELYRIFGRDSREAGASYEKLLNYVHPEDRDYVDKAIKRALCEKPLGIDYRIILPNGEERTVHSQAEVTFDKKNIPIRVKGIVQDITERKKAEEALKTLEIIRKKEIHHRIKNNLQVISSLLDLQAEKFKNKECIKDSEILEAFKESQDRVISIALIHEELHEGGGEDALNFSLYLERLVENLFHNYRLGDSNISLNMSLKKNIFFDMDIAVPLGMTVNELVSNSLKHAFQDSNEGEIQIKLFENELSHDKEKFAGKKATYTLIVSDNGVGIPENTDFENSDTLGLQLVNILVDQIDGEMELKRDSGTEFSINFSVEEKENL